MIRAAAAGLIVLAGNLLGPPAARAQERDFIVFDNMLYRGKPDTSTAGLAPANIVYEAWIWPHDKDYGLLPDHAAFDAIIRAHRGDAGPVILDIERLPLSGPPDVVRRHLDLLATLADWTHAAAPGRLVGFYGTHTLTRVPRQNLADARELARHVDALFPPMYTYDDDRYAWAKLAKTEAKEARAFAAGKPVYFYLWPQYHDKTPKQFQYVPVAYWKFQLATARRRADGVVIWGSDHFDWNETSGWWAATQDFVRSLPPAAAPR
jgi:hypothetical protein